jgi:putative intracellular protease/amidase
MARILIVLTSHEDLGDTGRQTGFYFEELTTPYQIFTDADHAVELASIEGGAVPHDPASLADDESERPASVRRFLSDSFTTGLLSSTHAIARVDPSEFDAIFLPGGHGVMWDLRDNAPLNRAIEQIHDAGGIVGAVCHGPAGFIGAQRDGKPFVAGRRINCFTDAEEEQSGLTQVVPFLLESQLRALGATVQTGDAFAEMAVRDDRLITGQNPASSAKVAHLMLDALSEARAAA